MENGKWIELSGDLYYFGQGGVNKIEAIDVRNNPSAIYITGLYMANTQIAIVKESVEEIGWELNKKQEKKC